jgi:hypothetical protein
LALDVQASPDARPGDVLRPLVALLLARARRARAEGDAASAKWAEKLLRGADARAARPARRRKK